VSLEAAFDSLHRQLVQLQEAVAALHVTVTEDRPTGGAAMLVDQLDAVVADLSGAIDEANVHLMHAVHASQTNAPLDTVRRAAHDVHRALNRFTELYVGELATHDRIAQLLEMGIERGHGWREWSLVVKTTIERSAVPMKTVADAMAESWAEVAERLARNSVSVQATNIGQHITVRDDQVELVGRVK
jgi:hypothetical protein